MTIARQWLAATAALGIAVLYGAMSMFDIAPGTRSVQPLSMLDPPPPQKFDPAHSAALFVGVREFDSDTSVVQFAVDDAVDLAYAFTFDGRSRHVRPERVVLALSGEPQKEESRVRLRRLREAGAAVVSPTIEELRASLQKQTERVPPSGLLIVSFATHGFVDDDGTHYLLGRDSTLDADTSLSASHVLDEASRAARSLVFVDACRERLPSGSRTGSTGPRSTAPSIRKMTPLTGQVVLYAAPPGGYAFDTDGNGVFTKAVLEALACKGPKNVSAERLQEYVDKRVQDWVKKERPGYRGGTQINMERRTDLMPLANCHCPEPPPPSDSWRAKLNLPILRSEIADLDGDCSNEVAVNTARTLHVFDADGVLRWKATDAFREFSVGKPYSGRRPVLAVGANGFSVFDNEGATLSTVIGDLQHVTFYRPTLQFEHRIAATSGDIVLLFKNDDPIPVWRRRIGGTIKGLEIADHDGNGRLDLVLITSAGRVALDVKGNPLNGARVEKLPRK